MKVTELFEVARRVPAGTISGTKKETTSAGRDPSHPHWDWRNPNDNPSGKKPVERKVDMKAIKAKAKEIVKIAKKDAEKYNEIGAADLIDDYVDHRKDPELWDEVLYLMMGLKDD